MDTPRRLLRLGLALGLLGSPHVQAQQLDIKVIGAGPSRTGTQSLAAALQKLGYRSTHGHYYLWHPRLRKAWKEWLHRGGSLEPALRLLAAGGVNATLDVPFHAAYREVMHLFPKAKVILTVRDSAESWHRSMMTFTRVYQSPLARAHFLLGLRRVGFSWREAALGVRMFNEDYLRLLDCDTDADPPSPEVSRRCLAGYERLVAEVKREVPPERLLVFNVRDGWGPLCHFLNVSVPFEPFPRVDQLAYLESASFNSRMRSVLVKLTVLAGCTIGLFGCACCWCHRRFFQHQARPAIGRRKKAQ